MAMLIAYVKWRQQIRKNCYGSVNERQNNQRKRKRWLDRIERDRWRREKEKEWEGGGIIGLRAMVPMGAIKVPFLNFSNIYCNLPNTKTSHKTIIILTITITINDKWLTIMMWLLRLKFHAIRATTTVDQLLPDTYVPDTCACGTARIPRRSDRRRPGSCCWPPSWSTARSAGSRRPTVELHKEKEEWGKWREFLYE